MTFRLVSCVLIVTGVTVLASGLSGFHGFGGQTSWYLGFGRLDRQLIAIGAALVALGIVTRPPRS